jgi:exonuclease III
MRIITWNCQMGLDKKVDALLSLKPDVAVVPECSEKSAVTLRQRGFNSLWFGSNPHKGLAVVSRQDWPLHALPQPKQKWIAAVEVDAPSPFTLIAVWACQIGTKRADNYIGQVYQALAAHPEWFDGHPVVLAGDLNSNKIWDAHRKVGNHSAVMKLLEERGLVSAYHDWFREPQGEESRPTMFFYRRCDRTFHLDYIFIPRGWASRLKTVEVGNCETWLKLSDHCPVVVEVVASAI